MQNRSRITINKTLEVARTLFINRQYADVSLKDIASEAGVTKGALYHHFATKEELYLKMMLHYMADLREQTATSVATTHGRPFSERLHHSLLGFLQLPEETIAVIRLVRRDSNIFQPAARQQLIDAYQSALPDLLQTTFSDAMGNGEIVQADTRLLVWQFVAIVEVSTGPYGRQVLGNTADLADFIVTNFVTGIKKQ